MVVMGDMVVAMIVVIVIVRVRGLGVLVEVGNARVGGLADLWVSEVGAVVVVGRDVVVTGDIVVAGRVGEGDDGGVGR